MQAILMTEEFWRNSQFSTARYYGRCNIDGKEYWIVNKEGKDLFQLSAEAQRAGRDKAIESGEPADLIRRDFIQYYRKLGRDKFITILKANPTASENELKNIYKVAVSY